MLSQSVEAHDFWIEKKDGKYLILSGHDNLTEGYEPERVRDWIIINVKGQKIKTSISKTEKGAYFNENGKDIALVNVFFDNKYWVKTTEGWKNIGKREAQKNGFQILESGRSYKFAKYINKWNDIFTKPLKTKIEIIPLNNPLKGENLTVKILLEDKPLKDAPIFLNGAHEESLRTDSDGKANISTRKGLNIISVTTKVPSASDPDGDQIYLRASISFNRE